MKLIEPKGLFQDQQGFITTSFVEIVESCTLKVLEWSISF
jgi:hypothetical protein